MTRDVKDIIMDMREIVKPCIAQMLFKENFEGKGNTDKAEFETEFEMILTLAERGATVEPQEKYDELMKQYKHLRKYASDLETRLSVEPQEWISINDRLPDEMESVLVCFESQGGIAMSVSERISDDRWSGLCGLKPTAWMPLPSPYKGGIDMDKCKGCHYWVINRCSLTTCVKGDKE